MMIGNRKILVCIIMLGFLTTTFHLTGESVHGADGTRASITINHMNIQRLEETQGFYALGEGAIEVNYTMVDAQTTINLTAEIVPPSGPQDDIEFGIPNLPAGTATTPLGEYIFNQEGAYDITIKMKSDQVTEVTGGPYTYNFKNITTLNLFNISMPNSVAAPTGEYGRMHHSISADITNEGNVGWIEDGINLNISIKSGGVPEEMGMTDREVGPGQCPLPGETVSIMQLGVIFAWLPSKEGTFTIEIKLTDLRTQDVVSDNINVEIENKTALDVLDILAPSNVTQGERFQVEGAIETNGTNCIITVSFLLEIKDSSNNVKYTNTTTKEIIPVGSGTGRTRGAVPILFTDIYLLSTGTNTIILKITEFSKEKQKTIEVTAADNDAPTVDDITGYLTSIHVGEEISFKLKFTDAKYTPIAIAQLLLDDEPAMEMVADNPSDEDFTDGKKYHYDWSALPGQHSYKFRISDGIVEIESDAVQFEVSNLTPGMGMVYGYIRDEDTNESITGVTVTINNLDTQNSTEVFTDNDGYYQAIVIYGSYTIMAEKAEYLASLRYNFVLSDYNFVVEKIILLTSEGGASQEYGSLTGVIKTIENGTDRYLGGAVVKLLNTTHFITSENATGAYEIRDILVGEYTIQISLPGYDKIEEIVNIVKGENQKDFTLVVKETGGNGGETTYRLVIQVYPRDTARVYLNGEEQPLNVTGRYAKKFPANFLVEIVASAVGYKTHTELVTIVETGMGTKIISLEKTGEDDDVEPLPTYPDKIGPIVDKDNNPVSDVEISFTYNGTPYKATTGSTGYAEFTTLFAAFPELNSTIPNGVTIAAEKEGWKSISWTHGKDIPTFTKIDTKTGGDGKDDKGGVDSWIYIAIAVIVLIVLIFVITFLLKKKGGGDDDDDEYEDDDDDDDDYSRDETPSAGPAGPQVSTSEMSTCKQCGTVVPSSTTFCPQCGNNMKTGGVGMMPPSQGSLPCKGCGTPIQQGIAFCPSCGMSATQQGPAVPQLPAQAPPEQPKLPPGPPASESAVDNLLSDATVGSPEEPLPPPPA